jgi:hypothetical protein
MRYPQLVVYETERRLVTWLREAVDVAELLRFDADGRPSPKPKITSPLPGGQGAATQSWLVHEPRQPAACLRLLQKGGPTVLILQLTKEPAEELELLEKAARRHPNALTVVIGEELHRSLVPLVWDLGATAVFLPPRVGERLQEIVLGLMQSLMARAHSDAGVGVNDES